MILRLIFHGSLFGFLRGNFVQILREKNKKRNFHVLREKKKNKRKLERSDVDLACRTSLVLTKSQVFHLKEDLLVSSS